MSRNNLRILYKNTVSSVSAYNTTTTSWYSIYNVLNDYRSRTDTAKNFAVSTSSIKGKIAIVVVLADTVASVDDLVMSVVLPNISSTVMYSSKVPASDSSNLAGSGGGGYAVLYLDTSNTSVNLFSIEFNRAVNVSKILVGNYWSPNYNTSYGVQLGYTDNSSFERMQNGDLYRTVAPRNKTISLELPFMDSADKTTLFDIIKSIGKSGSIFLSTFPEDGDPKKEQMYSIYGAFTNLSSIVHTNFITYASSVQIEEI